MPVAVSSKMGFVQLEAIKGPSKTVCNWNMFVLYFWGWTLQTKAMFIQNKGPWGSRYLLTTRTEIECGIWWPRAMTCTEMKRFCSSLALLKDGSVGIFRDSTGSTDSRAPRLQGSRLRWKKNFGTSHCQDLIQRSFDVFMDWTRPVHGAACACDREEARICSRSTWTLAWKCFRCYSVLQVGTSAEGTEGSRTGDSAVEDWPVFHERGKTGWAQSWKTIMDAVWW